jgi:hypothetical protein
LSCVALLARYGFDVAVCESHSIPGGAAHGFDRGRYRFDSGPSLYSGMSYSPSPNPLRQVLDAIAESPEWATYDTWGCHLPEGQFDTTTAGGNRRVGVAGIAAGDGTPQGCGDRPSAPGPAAGLGRGPHRRRAFFAPPGTYRRHSQIDGPGRENTRSTSTPPATNPTICGRDSIAIPPPIGNGRKNGPPRCGRRWNGLFPISAIAPR